MSDTGTRSIRVENRVEDLREAIKRLAAFTCDPTKVLPESADQYYLAMAVRDLEQLAVTLTPAMLDLETARMDLLRLFLWRDRTLDSTKAEFRDTLDKLIAAAAPMSRAEGTEDVEVLKGKLIEIIGEGMPWPNFMTTSEWDRRLNDTAEEILALLPATRAPLGPGNSAEVSAATDLVAMLTAGDDPVQVIARAIEWGQTHPNWDAMPADVVIARFTATAVNVRSLVKALREKGAVDGLG